VVAEARRLATEKPPALKEAAMKASRSLIGILAFASLLLGPLVVWQLAASPGGTAAAGTGDSLVVHEWGTFTVLQDEQGKPIGGINTDDEPLPDFVHNLNRAANGPSSAMPPVYFKGVERNHPDVVTRLETPVIYFYPPAGREMTVDVDVRFPAGWLTQYYPDAQVSADGRSQERFEVGPLTYKSMGTLSWRGLTIGGTPEGPKTDVPAWLAPRRVPAAASVRTPKGEAERYLFYRGVGRIDAPLRVSRSADGTQLEIRSQIGNAIQVRPGMKMGPLWLVDARADGTSAFRTIEAIDLTAEAEKVLATTPGAFSESDYRAENLGALRKALHAALVRDGLYDDEADGLLNTWEASYFKRPGLRMFFMTPREWTDAHLPLRVSAPAQVQRVMVGRIELVTPRHRELLRKISAGPTSSPEWVMAAREQLGAKEQDQYYREDWYLHANANPTAAKLLQAMPDDYRAYLRLGRFRNALLLDEARRRPSSTLATFIDRYELEALKFERGERASAN
jgi:hypothetical protein